MITVLWFITFPFLLEINKLFMQFIDNFINIF